MSMPLFDPTAAPVGREVKIAPRPLRLDGLRIGLVEMELPRFGGG